MGTLKHNATHLAAQPGVVREVMAVLLWCSGVLTGLSLLSFAPQDVTLRAAGAAAVHNWIGPAGALWADYLLQHLGVGAYALAGTFLLAGWRAFCCYRIWPGLREMVGCALLVVAVGTFAQLLCWGQKWAYPVGGLPGVLLGPVLRERFAPLGAYIVAGGFCLVALAVTVDGIVWGLGWRGVSVWRAAAVWLRRGYRHVAVGGRKVLQGVRRFAAAKGAQPQGGNPGRKRLAKPRRGDDGVGVSAVAPLGDAALAVTAPVPPPALAADDGAVVSDRGHTAELEVPSAAASEVSQLARVAAKRRATAPLEPHIVNVRADLPPIDVERAASKKMAAPSKRFELPPVSLLDYQETVREPLDPAKLRDNALRLTKTLKDYGIDGHVREIRPGPVVTMYEYVPGPGIKLSKIASLADDLAMSMEALRVRIVAPIPGKGAVGIEIPNETRETVYLKEIIAHDTFRNAKGQLTMALGKNIEGGAYVADMARMPHLLVAGATGAGKSVSVNAMIMSVLYRSTPDEVRMLMVDPKMLELSAYEGIPHLLLPVVTDPKKAALALRWAVEEMERRYELLSEVGVRSIDGYNAKVDAAKAKGSEMTLGGKQAGQEATVCERLPYLLVIVDELADLMMVASREVETSIMRLAQMARAAGIHLILATQRPSVDVLTGVIKANFPTRIAFQVASRHDSRTIIDGNGAEHLLGYGDMLFMSPGAGGLMRVHGAFVSDEEIERVVAFVRQQGSPEYDESILAPRDDADEAAPVDTFMDDMYDQAIAIVAETRQASISMIQRRLRIGYNRAARMVERMETEGVVGPADGAKPREVLVSAM